LFGGIAGSLGLGSLPAMNASVQSGIKLPIALQVLRDEIQTLDRYIRQGRLSQDEAAARLEEWDVAIVPGFYRFDRLALLNDWKDDTFKEDILKHFKSMKQPLPPKTERQYRTPQATIDAYRYLKREADAARLEQWLKAHPRDADYLRSLSDGV
jgi:hypothetical protein